MASLGSKVFLLASVAFAGGVIYMVHSNQAEDRARLHQGIVKDLERQSMKKTANIKRLQDQAELEKRYRERSSEE